MLFNGAEGHEAPEEVDLTLGLRDVLLELVAGRQIRGENRFITGRVIREPAATCGRYDEN